MSWSQKKLSPAEKGWPPQVGKQEGGAAGEGRIPWCLSSATDRGHVFPHSRLLVFAPVVRAL